MLQSNGRNCQEILLKISVKSFSCRDLNEEVVVMGSGNKLPATGKAKHVCFGNLAQGLNGVEVKQKEP